MLYAIGLARKARVATRNQHQYFFGHRLALALLGMSRAEDESELAVALPCLQLGVLFELKQLLKPANWVIAARQQDAPPPDSGSIHLCQSPQEPIVRFTVEDKTLRLCLLMAVVMHIEKSRGGF